MLVVRVRAIFSRPALAAVLYREELVPKGTCHVSAPANCLFWVIPQKLSLDINVLHWKGPVLAFILVASK